MALRVHVHLRINSTCRTRDHCSCDTTCWVHTRMHTLAHRHQTFMTVTPRGALEDCGAGSGADGALAWTSWS